MTAAIPNPGSRHDHGGIAPGLQADDGGQDTHKIKEEDQ